MDVKAFDVYSFTILLLQVLLAKLLDRRVRVYLGHYQNFYLSFSNKCCLVCYFSAVSESKFYACVKSDLAIYSIARSRNARSRNFNVFRGLRNFFSQIFQL